MTRRQYSRRFGLTFFAVVAALALLDWRNISLDVIGVCAAGAVITLLATRNRRQSCAVIPLPRPKHLHPAAPIGIHDELEGVG